MVAVVTFRLGNASEATRQAQAHPRGKHRRTQPCAPTTPPPPPQVILKPDPGNPQELYLGSLEALGIDTSAHDVRFVEDNWESPVLGAWGLGWEVWLDGMEVTQFTYFQQAGGKTLEVPSVEITYGMERILMALQVRWAAGKRWLLCLAGWVAAVQGPGRAPCPAVAAAWGTLQAGRAGATGGETATRETAAILAAERSRRRAPFPLSSSLPPPRP